MQNYWGGAAVSHARTSLHFTTVEPPYNGQLGMNVQCPLFGGVRCIEVSYCFAYFDAQCMFCSIKPLP